MSEFNVEDLIGREINYTWKSQHEESRAIIAGIVEGVGWTLVDAEDKKKELCCWNGPKSPNVGNSDIEAFELAWPVVVEMLKEGYYDSDKVFSAGGFEQVGGGGMTCAFT